MRERVRAFFAILKDVWVRHSEQSSNAFEQGTCLLAYRVELNIHSADSLLNLQGLVALENEDSMVMRLKHEWTRLFLPNACVPAYKSPKGLVV